MNFFTGIIFIPVPLPFSMSANDLEESLLLLPTVYDTANVNKQSNVYEITFDASYGKIFIDSFMPKSTKF